MEPIEIPDFERRIVDEEGEEEARKITHNYYTAERAQAVVELLKAWDTNSRGTFKTSAILNPARMGKSIATIYMMFTWGRRYLIEHCKDLQPIFDKDDTEATRQTKIKHCEEMRKYAKIATGVAVTRTNNLVKLTFEAEGWVASKLVEACEFGIPEEAFQDKLVEWMESDPAHGEHFPTEPLFLDDADMKAVLHLRDELSKAKIPRFVFRIKGQTVLVRSIKEVTDDHS